MNAIKIVALLVLTLGLLSACVGEDAGQSNGGVNNQCNPFDKNPKKLKIKKKDKNSKWDAEDKDKELKVNAGRMIQISFEGPTKKDTDDATTKPGNIMLKWNGNSPGGKDGSWIDVGNGPKMPFAVIIVPCDAGPPAGSSAEFLEYEYKILIDGKEGVDPKFHVKPPQ